MHPAQSDYYYFVADAAGHHRFARTIEEHDKNVATYRRAMQAMAGSGAYNLCVNLKDQGQLARRANPWAGRRVSKDRDRGFGPSGNYRPGIETLQRRNKRHDLAALESVIREYAVHEIVVSPCA